MGIRLLGCRYRVRMEPRTDIITASRVDLALIPLAAITWMKASCMLAVNGVPEEVAARVLALPGARRVLAEVEILDPLEPHF